MAGPGIGKTSLTEAIAERLAGQLNILQIHGSSALAAVPFGVLTPYTGDLTAEESVSPVAVLRSMWTYFEKLKAGSGAPVLLIVDDAHHLDEASAGVVADLISAGWATVVAAARPRPGLPQPLDQLWYDGLAERVDLRPLNRDQIDEVLAHVLDGTVPPATIDSIWQASGGNPRILDALLHDAAESGVLAKRNGIWVLLGHLPADGPQLTAVVTKDHLRRGPEEQEALKLIALAGPVGRKVIEDISGASVVRSLLDQQMISESSGVPAELFMWNALFAKAIRNTLSVSRSLQLLEKIRAHQDGAALRGEGMLRSVEWAFEVGLRIPDDEMLRAAREALRRFRNDSARTIAAKVRDPALVPLAKAIQARALYNEGVYGPAAELLDACWRQLSGTGEGPAVVLLRAAAHQAKGAPLRPLADDMREHIRQLDDGDRFAPEQLLHVVRLLELGAEVDAEALAAEVREIRNSPSPDAGGEPVRALGEALLAHALAAAGRASEGLDSALLAASELPPLEDSLFFYTEFVLGRLVTDYLAMGEWESAGRELDNYAASHSPGADTFNGSLQILRGYSLLRQGRMERAYQVLLPAVEALRLNDPLQLFRFGSALGFYVAARLGDTAQAQRLEQDYSDAAAGGPAHELLAAAYNAAAAEYLSRDGKGLAALHTLATTHDATARAGTLLELLAICWDLGDPSVIPVVQSVAGTVEGRWAQAMLTLATRWEEADGDALMETASNLEESGFVNLAREAYARASTLLEQAGERRRSRQAVAMREKCDHELGERFREGRFIAAAPAVHLTRREQDIVELAVQGLTDREIAQRLMVSVRTVEGHLYRTYVKLGVRSRDELESALPK
ncbi:DNA-binding CsgD family transcriptional regulator/tetratricopeptide (TPR) repeat protein [Pseudarthrobacter siccitolerans]|uniref:DNA-binding CsgD family transcriptional regulator/tetratricopeptide (TPR) repeat protein n=2 Tax=Pseudarthrobacter siccitolerans TaxID=861266 RepID=A0ABU0PST7_9MICC|nr:helix-turn-helix transcriptional regulator [Pseudarthrobacter siccitolerans]MDQ0676324.1 DNA-binding CsgD family transcriptional regulator/tetratricopeptide (TPR) repeat protein [Pseudarthrobacter siccitolerans]